MYVCVCNQVTDSAIRAACAEGAHSIGCLQTRLKVATRCGRCEECARRLLREAHDIRLAADLGATA
jgi:bacterioferritin-associated ferredoxin